MADEMRHRLRQLRERAGLSARELGPLAGLSSALVAHIENGITATPLMKSIRALADVLGADLEWLVNGRREAPTDDQIHEAVERARANTRAEAEASDLHAATGTDGLS